VPARLTFPRSRRLIHALDFQRAYAARMRAIRLDGAMVIFGRATDLPHPRLGLAVGRGAGPAVERNRIKRLVREAFRLEQHALPPGLDFVVSVRRPIPPALGTLDALRAELTAAADHIECIRRRRDKDRPA
jgi:ribonuclease P protein component